MSKKNSKRTEFNNFSQIASEWWKTNGKFKILHEILPIRIEYILNNLEKKINKNFEILDLGCGGGLTCEPLARLGAKVTGIDFIKQNIKTAKIHALESKLDIEYIHQDLDMLSLNKKYDLILLLEVLEHMDNWHLVIKNIKKYLKPGGKIIISTINKTQLSKIFGIFFAENILKWVPKNTHDYNKLIKPEELIKTLEQNNLIIKNLTGMNYNILSKSWSLSKRLYPINYFCTAILD